MIVLVVDGVRLADIVRKVVAYLCSGLSEDLMPLSSRSFLQLPRVS